MADQVDLLSTQVELMRTMNGLLEQQYDRLASIEAAIKGQSVVTEQAREAAAGYNAETERSNEVNTAAAASFDSVSASAGTFGDALKKFVDEGIIDNFANSQRLLGVNLSSLASIISNPLAAAMGFFAEAWNSISEKAAQVYREMLQLASAVERIREKFGSFSEGAARRTREAFKTLGSTITTTSENARAFSSKFAPGFEGAEQRLNKTLEIAEDLSSVMDAMGQEFLEAKDQLYLLKDGLLFSGEALKQTAVLSRLAGKTQRGFSEEILATVNKIGKSLGVTTKLLGKDVGAVLSNFKMLGRMTGDYVKEITKAAAFTRKLGIELNELAGLVDKFDEFEGGAEAAAQLAQGFGMVIDPLKMMGMEAGPRLQELQRAFMATGRSIESMSRQERKLLADTAGLTEQQALLAFSSKGMSMSYDEISAGAETATKQQKTMDQVFNEVLDNIPNIITGFKEAAGFVEAFMEGFGVGFGRELLPTLIKLAKDMGTVFRIGIEAGTMFFDVVFPKDVDGKTRPLLKFIESIGDMFVGLATHVKDFIGDVKNGDVAGAVQRLLTNVFGTIKKTFLGGSSMFDLPGMIRAAGSFFIDVFKGAVQFLIQQMPVWTAELGSLFTEGEGGLLGALFDTVGKMFKELPQLVLDLLPEIRKFGDAIIDAIIRFFEEYPITTLFMSSGPIATFTTGFGKNLFDLIAAGFSGDAGALATAKETAKKGLNKGITDIEAEAKRALDPKAGAATSTNPLAGAVDSVKKKAAQAKSWVDDAIEAGKGFAKAGAVATGVYFLPDILVHLAKGLRDSILVFTGPLPNDPSGKSLMDVLKDQVAKFAGIDPESIKAVGFIVAGLVAASLGISGAAVIGLGAPSPQQMEQIKASLSSTALAVKGVIETVGSPDMATALAKAPVANDRIAKLKVVSKGMEGLGDSLEGIISALPSTKALDAAGATGSTFGEKMRSVITTVLGLFKDQGSNKGIMSQIAEITVPADLTKKKVDRMIEVAEAAGRLGEISSKLVDLGKSGATSADITTALTLSKTIGNEMPAVITSFGGLPETSIQSANELKMKAALNVLTSYMEAMKRVNESAQSAAVGASWISVFSVLLTAKGPNTLNGLMTSLGDPALFPEAGAMDANQKKIDKFFATVDKFLDRLDETSAKFSEDRQKSYYSRVSAIIEHVANVRRVLEDMDTLTLDATLDNFAENLKVTNQVFSIAGGAVNVNVQLNVTMNAEKLAGAMVIGGYLAPSSEFGTYLQKEKDEAFSGLSTEMTKKYSTQKLD